MTDTTRIGPRTLLDTAPTVVTLADTRYILSRNPEGDPVMYSAVCPHQGGRVKVIDESTLRCPTHRWEFDAETGACVHRGDEPLTVYDVHSVDGELFAALD